VSELRYWQRKARYSATGGAALWLLLGVQQVVGDGRFFGGALLLVVHGLWGIDALKAHLALREADR
jgi:hypothetical protein